LLAYLDDQLEPAEIKRIGQKVAESDAAQELIARIKQVTRRRRLTTPTDGGAGERFDANIVAAYLDSELPSEQVAELEKLCLESDVHLAEVSACHQILTLVLGEPALIPPTARRRMYALVKGRKPKPAPKPVPAATSPNGQPANAEPDADETLLLGLPLFRRAPWLRWAVPLAAVLLLALLGGVLWKTLASSGGSPHVAANGNPNDDSAKDRKADQKKEEKKEDKTKQPDKGPAKDKSTKPDKDKPKEPDKNKPKDPAKGTAALPPSIGKPNEERKEAGRFISTGAVLARQGKDGEWHRVPVDSTVQTGEALVSLPGYKSELRLGSGVGLLLWGALPEMGLPPQLERLLESAVTVHNPARGLDADLTLQHGRVYLSNRKEKGLARVRLRFWREEVWDITLEEPDAVVGVEFISRYQEYMQFKTGEEPSARLFFFVMKGKAGVKINYDTFAMQAPPGLAFASWSNKSKNKNGLEIPPTSMPALSPFWNPDRRWPGEAQNLVAAREELAAQLAKPGKTLEVGLEESLQSSKSDHRILAVRCLGALDDVSALIDALGDPMHPDVRHEAANALRVWLGRGKEQAAKLYDRKKRAGILTEKKFRRDEAESVLDLLDEFIEDELRQPETYESLLAYLKHNRLEVRELAYGQLLSIFKKEGSKINYNPAGNSEQINQGYEDWKKVVNKLLPKKSGG